jgi:hypothetical protein
MPETVYALCFGGALSITASSFQGNASGWNGAAIHLENGVLELSDSLFDDNFARWGGVNCENSQVNVRDCEFQNMLMDGGCGVLMYGGALDIRYCLFQQLIGGDLGAIDLNGATAVIAECDFIDCRASTFEGGAIYVGPTTSSGLQIRITHGEAIKARASTPISLGSARRHGAHSGKGLSCSRLANG